jgi:hypothetical protein
MGKCSTCGASAGPSYGEAFWELAQHVVMVTASFLLIFAVAIGIDQLVRLLSMLKLVSSGTPLEWALLGAKYFLLAGDLVMLAALLIKFGYRAIRKF